MATVYKSLKNSAKPIANVIVGVSDVTIMTDDKMSLKIIKDSILRNQVIRRRRGNRMYYESPKTVAEQVKAALKNGLYSPYWLGPEAPVEGKNEEVISSLGIEKLLNRENKDLDSELVSADNIHGIGLTGGSR